MSKKIESLNQQTILSIIPVMEHDIRLFLITDLSGKIIGLNFHYGLDDTTLQDVDYYSVPCPHLTEIFRRLAFNKSDLLCNSKNFVNNNKSKSVYYLDNSNRAELLETIIQAINLYVRAFVIQ